MLLGYSAWVSPDLTNRNSGHFGVELLLEKARLPPAYYAISATPSSQSLEHFTEGNKVFQKVTPIFKHLYTY